MNRPSSLRAGLALALAALLVVTVPETAARGAEAELGAVGAFLVDASGRVLGAHLSATALPDEGALVDVATGDGRALFSRVESSGLVSVERLDGVGSAALALRGEDAILTLHDDVHGALRVEATQETLVRFAPAPGILPLLRDDAPVVDLQSRGEWIGSLVASGQASLSVTDDAIEVLAGPGATVAFLGRAQDLPEAWDRVLVEAAADGHLASSVVTGFDARGLTASRVDLGAERVVRTIAERRGAIETTIRSQAASSAVVAYDLAYESLPVRDAADVAVFVDGYASERARSADEVLALARQGIASYHATVEDGRALVLAATPTFESTIEHTLVVAARAAATQAQARAEREAGLLASVTGALSLHENGRVTGDFVTTTLARGNLELLGYAPATLGAEVFRSVRIPGSLGEAQPLADGRLLLSSSRADLTLIDDAYATLLLEGKARGEAVFRLASGVQAVADAPGAVRLESARGDVGWLLAVPGEAEAALDITSRGVEASLDPGARVVFRAASDAFPSEPDVARAIAAGDVGAQLLAGIDGGAVVAQAETLAGAGDLDVTSQARGRLEMVLRAAGGASSVVIDARGGLLLAKSPSDLRVLVDGNEAVLAATVEDALAASAVPRFAAEPSADGALRLVVNAATRAGETARIVVESKLQESARAAASTDAFGAFEVLADGSVVGDFVSLRAHREAGAVTGVTLLSQAREVFSSIAAGASPFESTGVDGAATLVLQNAESRIEIADSTSGLVKVLATARTQASLRMAEGLTLVQRAPGIVEVLDGSGDRLGSLLLVGEGDLVATDAASARATLERGAQLIFRSHVGLDGELSLAQRAMVDQAIAAGQVAGQVVVQTRPVLDDTLEASSRLADDGPLASHGELTSALASAYAPDVAMVAATAKGRVEVTLASAQSVGKTLLVSLDAQTLPSLARGEAEILFDGLPIEAADSYADVLNALDDGGAAEYFALAGEAGTQVLVSIPHFSVRTVTLQEREAQGAGALVPYVTVFLGLLVVAQTALLVRARRKA